MASGTPVRVTYDAEHRPVVDGMTRAGLRPNSSAQFEEHVLQAIIDQHPDVLPWREFFPAATAICSLGREIPVELGGQVGERTGYIDNLLVTDDGHLVLVETKLWRNPEAVRKVIAQVMEYAMAVSELGLDGLEQAIRRGEAKSHRLGPDEGIADRMRKVAGTDGDLSLLDDFEDAFARFRQTGELLVLIVADSVRSSVERLTKWFGDHFAPGSPIRLGLVELRFYDIEGGHLVFPVTLLRTKELGRHTVVVEVREGKVSDVGVTVLDAEAGRLPAVRQVSEPDAILTKDKFLARVREALAGERLATVERVVAGLDALGLATRGTPTRWQYGVTDGSAVRSFVSLGARDLWCQLPSRLRAALGDARYVECKRILNAVAPFFRPEDVDDPSKANELAPKYDVLVGKEQEFITAIAEIAEMARTTLREQS